MILLRFVKTADAKPPRAGLYDVYIGDYKIASNIPCDVDATERAIFDETDPMLCIVVWWWLYVSLGLRPTDGQMNLVKKLLFTDTPEKVLDILLLTC